MAGKLDKKPCRSPAPSLKSISGKRGAVDCTCTKVQQSTERITVSGLKIIRSRFGLHRSELPFLDSQGLKWYLLSLLSPTASLPSLSKGRLRCFPRTFAGYDNDGFPILKRLGRSERWELAHSCSSLARSLPLSCVVHAPSKIDSWARTASSTPPPSSPEYLQFCRKLVRKTFRYGWDKVRYPASVQSFAPQASKRAESHGMNVMQTASSFWTNLPEALAYPNGHGPLIENSSAKAEFVNLALHGRPVGVPAPVPDSTYSSPPLPFGNGFHLRVKEIPTVGKTRVIGIPSLNYDLLGPLHRSIFGHLTSRDWLMHGTPTADRIKDVCRGAIQTSVDLTNATDGLRLDVTEAILGSLLAKTVSVPGSIKELAFNSLYPSTNYPVKGGHRVSHGQMMGTYLSFPLLCLHSFCAASWAARNSGLRGLLINGDDTIISHDRPLQDYPEGYEKNESKTITSSTTCELNSTVFLRSRDSWIEVRNLRRVGAETDFKGIRHMADACQRAGPKWVTAFIRSGIGKRWGLSPKDLGLSTRHRLVWLRQFRARGALSDVKFPDHIPDPRYLTIDHQPSPEEMVEFGIDLFNNGRSTVNVPDFNPSRNQVMKTRGKRRPDRVSGHSIGARTFVSNHTYEFHRDSREATSNKIWLVLQPTDFDSIPEYSTREIVGESDSWVEDESRGAHVLAPNSATLAPSNYAKEFLSQSLGCQIRLLWE